MLEQPAVQGSLFAATAAVTVFVGTQWILHCRERTSLLAEKLESLFTSISTLTKLGQKRIEFYVRSGTVDDLKEVAGSDITDQISMYQSLYFPTFVQPINRLLELDGNVVRKLAGRGRAETLDDMKEIIAELNMVAGEVKTLITRNQLGLTRASFRHYLPFTNAPRLKLAVEDCQ